MLRTLRVPEGPPYLTIYPTHARNGDSPVSPSYGGAGIGKLPVCRRVARISS